jgi:hypothetical protein
LLEIREVVPEGQAPSPSLDAFNKSFGTSHCGELLSVGFEAASIGNGASKILTLWKSPTLVDETGEEGSKQTGGVARESGKGPHSAQKKTFASLGKTSSNSGKKVTMQNLSKQGSFLFINFLWFSVLRFFLMIPLLNFQSSRISFIRILHPNSRSFKRIILLSVPCLGKLPLNGSLIKRN